MVEKPGKEMEFSKSLVGIYKPGKSLLIGYLFLQVVLLVELVRKSEFALVGIGDKSSLIFWLVALFNVFAIIVFFLKIKKVVEITPNSLILIDIFGRNEILIESIEYATFDETGLNIHADGKVFNFGAFGSTFKEIQLFEELEMMGIKTNEFMLSL